MSINLILASQSSYKKQVFSKLNIPFSTVSPNIDESPMPDEPANQLVSRLSKEKAKAGITKYMKEHVELPDNSYIIGVDQVAVLGDAVLGKPGTHANATQHLRSFSGKTVCFLTGLCVMRADGDFKQLTESYSVKFRSLNEREIDNYLTLDKPYDCAGSFKCEGMGPLLFEEMSGRDINSLIGLPLIGLSELFREFNVDLLDVAAQANSIKS